MEQIMTQLASGTSTEAYGYAPSRCLYWDGTQSISMGEKGRVPDKAEESKVAQT